MNNIFNEHMDSVKTKYDTSMFLGRLCWYSISEDSSTNHFDFCQSIIENFKECTIMPQIPPAIRKVDLFKRACTSSQRKNCHTGISGFTRNYMVRPAGSDIDKVCRTIVREELDSNGHTLHYEELIQITFDRKLESINFKLFSNMHLDPDDTANEIVHDIKKYYFDSSAQLTAYAVRLLTQRILERQIRAIKVRPSGGVYFVQERFSKEIEALEKTIEALPNASFHTLPLLDDGKQREMLRTAFEAESINEIDRLMGEIAEIMKSGKTITIDKYAKFKEEYEQNRQKVLDFSDVLNDALEGTAVRLEMMSNQLFELVNSVKE